MPKEIIHSLLLIFTIALTFVFPKTNLSQFDLQISAGLFITLFLAKRLFISNTIYSRLIESVVFTFIVVATVNVTGGTASPFFFLVYFLLFSLTLILEPVISITTTVSLII